MPSIKRTDYPSEYSKAARSLQEMEDKNFCSPLALSLVTGISVEQAAKMMEEKGRKTGKGTSDFIFEKCLNELGYRKVIVNTEAIIRKFPRPHCDVLKNLTTHHGRRFPGTFDKDVKYVARTSGHILAIIDGEVKDWSINRSLRIFSLHKVEKCDDAK